MPGGYYGNNNQNRGQNNYSQNNRGSYSVPVMNIEAIKLPERYVDEAEKVINEIQDRPITNTKLRKLFGLYTDLYNEVKRNPEIPLDDQQIRILSTARVRMIYESGREAETATFIRKAKLLNYLKSVGNNRKEFITFYNYFEALVAYHRFRFGDK